MTTTSVIKPTPQQQRKNADVKEPQETAADNSQLPEDVKPISSLEEAAVALDALLVPTPETEQQEAAESKTDGDGQEEVAEEEPVLLLEIDGEEREVPVSEIAAALQSAAEIEEERTTLKDRARHIDETFQEAASELARLIPALQRQLMGEFANVRTPEDLTALAAANPVRFAEYQARRFALDKAEEQAEALRQFEFDRARTREDARLKTLVPELTEGEGAEELHKALKTYGQDQGFDDDRFARAAADEIAVLYKAMKYDRLMEGQEKAAARARQGRPAARVLTPGTRKAADPASGYRKAMASLKKSGHVEDAAKVIEMML